MSSTQNVTILGALQPHTLSAAGTTRSVPMYVQAAKTALNVIVNVTAITGTSPTLALTAEWSTDGTNWAVNDGTAETWTSITATGVVVKQLVPKAPYLRLKEVAGGTTPSITYSADLYLIVQD